MYSKVKQLRQRGARRTDRDIAADPGTLGHITLVRVAGRFELKLHADGDSSHRSPIIPILFDAMLVSMDQRMLFCGLERVGDQADPHALTVMQEWAVEIMVDQSARK